MRRHLGHQSHAPRELLRGRVCADGGGVGRDSATLLLLTLARVREARGGLAAGLLEMAA